jgi:hypothetical protein
MIGRDSVRFGSWHLSFWQAQVDHCLKSFLPRFPVRSWEKLRTQNIGVWPIFHEAAGQLGLVSNLDQEAEICVQDTIELTRPPRDTHFLLAQMAYYKSSREAVQRRFWDNWQSMKILWIPFVAGFISCSTLILTHLVTVIMMITFRHPLLLNQHYHI